MRDDFEAIADADDGRADAGMALSRIYHDIGLAAVAEALDLLTVDFDPELNTSLERGEFFLLPSQSLAQDQEAAA